MRFTGLPCNLVEGGIFLASSLLLNIITEETLSLLNVLTLAHLKILFKQLEKSAAGSSLALPHYN